MIENVLSLEKKANAELDQVSSAQDLEAFRIQYFGKKGQLNDLMKHLKEIDPSARKDFGQAVNRVKNDLEAAFKEKQAKLPAKSVKKKSVFDESLPGIAPTIGRKHPITQTIEEISEIFARLGFEAVQGPEVETEFHNFTALNIPVNHTSRDAVDTFYTENGYLLRSQTSTAQICVMESRKPPLKIISPGRVYRPDTVDASHSFMFHQLEGLMVDEETTFSDLKGILELFLQELFGPKTKLRFRPHFFPFTEPSVEVDIMWGKRGWLEILGAGSVNPKVFEAVHYDTKKIRGFAFGLGIERIAMLRHGIDDIRYFYENDLRFLRQF